MRADERHRLKTNELAQKLSELPEYLRRHSKIISIGVVAVVVVCVVGGFWWSARKKTQSQRNEELQGLFPQIVQVQYSAARAAQDSKTQSETTYNISSLLGALGNLSSEAQGTPIGMMALMQQADLKRSELYYSHRLLSDQDRENICRASESLYNQILSEYPNHALAVGMAKLGLALVAEDRGDWEKAKKTYEEILVGKDGKLAGTTFPLLAQRRLRLIDEIAISIEFPYIEPVPETPEITAADKETVDPLKGIEPIKIELPKAPVPQVKTYDKPIGPVMEEAETEKKPENSKQPEPKSAGETPADKDEKKEN